MSSIDVVSTNDLPNHIAIILDGNGRWAEDNNLSRSQGHIEGLRRVEEVAYAASDLGIKVLTVYTFSTENWKRPEGEVAFLMKIITQVLYQKVDQFNKRGISFRYIGKRDGIPPAVFESIDIATEKTKNNSGLILNMAFNYGSRTEILDAVKTISSSVANGELDVSDINEQMFSEALYTKGLPDPDLLVRTSGEKRISNFLLWQLSYAEFYFTDKYWPEFDQKEFSKAIKDFQSRERRFGKVNEIN